MTRLGVIYLAINKVNGKIYIGKTINFLSRKSSHISKSFKPESVAYKYYFHNAIRKYTPESFIWLFVWEGDASLLTEKEIYYIKLFNSNSRLYGYSMTEGGEGQLNRLMSEETKEKIRQANIGKRASDETKRKMSLKSKGRKYPPEFGERIRLRNLGKKASSETIEKQRLARVGFKHSEETKIKMKQLTITYSYKNRSPIVYNFINTQGENFIGTQYEFYTKYNLCKKGVNSLVRNKRKSFKNWKLLLTI